MPTFHSVLANTARILYCTRVPHGWEYDRLARLARFFHWVQLVFEALDVINLVTDGIFVVNLFFTNEIQALTLLIGMILARGCSQKGHSLSFHGGLYWAPFFCADPADSITLNAERESALFLLYGLVFAELCVFFFEDSTLILIYYWNSEALHQLNDFDRFNIWLTLLSVTATSLLLGACILGSINLVWCRGRSWIYKQQQLGFRDKLCVVMSCLTAWVLRLLRAGLFLLFLSFVGLCLFFACGAASSILIFGYQYNTSEPGNQEVQDPTLTTSTN